MEFTPKNSQPFSLAQATALEIPIITQEIARLQLSLKNLQSTQDVLEIYLHGTDSEDKELRNAYEENKDVIDSQQERVRMLRLALQLKGGSAASNPHYEPIASQLPQNEVVRNASQNRISEEEQNSDINGVYL